MNRYIKIKLIAAITLCITSCLGTDEAELAGAFLPPQVTLDEAKVVSDNVNVTFSGSYDLKGASTSVDECGFYYGANPELESAQKVEAESESEIFSVEIPFTEHGAKYYYKAYASNGRSEISTSVKSFQVPDFSFYIRLGAPSVVSSVAGNVTITSSLDIAKGLTVAEKGLLYSNNKDNILTQGSKTVSSAEGDITVEIKSLSTGSKYYMCSYVSNGINTAYSEVVEFTPHFVPTLTTDEISEISCFDAVSGGTNLSGNGLEITSKGLVWSTIPTPTIDLSTKTEDGMGQSAFTSKITGLSPRTKYYVRAYAVNSEGVGYGNEITFETLSKEDCYIDEYGVVHGRGTEVDGVVWAPVNCGYHETDFKYGKLYQWGRKYGQGYSGAYYDVYGNFDPYSHDSDASVPIIKYGRVSLSTGQSKSNEEYFYVPDSSEFDCDWLSPSDQYLWKSGSEYDPCPDGWRIPTATELRNLMANKSSWTTENGQTGYWFCGSASYSVSVPSVFFPAAGIIFGNTGYADERGLTGYYWSSQGEIALDCRSYAKGLWFENGKASVSGNYYRAGGWSIRCVQE